VEDEVGLSEEEKKSVAGTEEVSYGKRAWEYPADGESTTKVRLRKKGANRKRSKTGKCMRGIEKTAGTPIEREKNAQSTWSSLGGGNGRRRKGRAGTKKSSIR